MKENKCSFLLFYVRVFVNIFIIFSKIFFIFDIVRMEYTKKEKDGRF